jgi:hypothetical protein
VIREQASRWMHYTVSWINQTLPYFQNTWVASFTLVGLNVICFEVALRVCRCTYRLFSRNRPTAPLSSSDARARAWGLGIAFATLVGLGNWTFCRLLSLPLSRGRVGAISLSTCLIYLFWKTYHHPCVKK